MATDRPVTETINGVEYAIGTLDTMTQWHVARRLSPILGELSGAFKRMAAEKLFGNVEDPEPTKTVEQIQAEVEAGVEPEVAAAPDEFLENGKVLDMFDILAKPISKAISEMSDKDSEYVIKACLSVVKRKQQRGYAPVIEPRSGALLFQDIKLKAMLTLTVCVIMENIGDF